MKRQTFKTFFSITGTIIIAKLLGFVKQTVSASLFGATLETDLITLSQGFLGNLDYVLVQILLTSFTSIYIHLLNADTRETYRTISDTMRAFALIAGGVAVVAFFAAPLLARILAPSYGVENLSRLTFYMRIYLPLLPLFSFSAIFTAILNAHKHFLPAELISINQSFLFLLIVLLFHNLLREQSMIAAFFAYTIWNLLFLGFLSRQYWTFSWSGNPFSNSHVKGLLRMCAPLLLSYSMVFINQQVDKSLTSGLGEGAVTALGYGSVLSNLISTFIVSFCSILFTYTATEISKGNHQKAATLAVHVTSLLILVFFPITLLTVLCAKDIVSIVFGHGAFDTKAVEASANALRGYAFLFIPLILREVYTRFQYGYQDTCRSTIASSIGIVCNIILSIFLSRYLGIFGISISTSIAVLVSGTLNFLSSQKLNHFLNFAPLLYHQLPLMILGGGICLCTVYWINGLLANTSAFFRFIIAAFSGLLTYFFLTAPILWKLLQHRISSKFFFGRDEFIE